MAGRLGGRGARAHSFNILFAVATLLLAVAAIMKPAAASAQVSCTEQLGECKTGTCQADGTCQLTPLTGGSCDDHNPCTVNDTCANGECNGTPASGGSCNDGNPCTTSDTCASGACRGTPKQTGDSCDYFGKGTCLGTCQVLPFVGAFCMPPMCDDTDGNMCTVEACNPLSNHCEVVFTETCNEECTAGQCDPSSGDCLNMQPKSDTTTCDDGNICTGNDHCQTGECLGSGGNVPTATVGAATGTPTRTPTHVPTSSPTASPTATQTGLTAPTATGTALATNTPSGQVVCVGACTEPTQVTVDNVILLVNISLGSASPSACVPGIPEGSDVTIDLIIQAVNNLLVGCPAPPATATPQPTGTVTQTSPAAPTRSSTATGTQAVTATRTLTQPATPTTTSAPPTPSRTVTGTPAPSATRTQTTALPSPTATAATSTPSRTNTQTTATPSQTGGPATATPTPTDTEIAPTAGETGTPTPTVSQGAATSTPTATLGPPNVPRRVAGFEVSSTNTFLLIPNLISPILTTVGRTSLSGLGSSGSSASDTISTVPSISIPIPFPCPGGGGGMVLCVPDPSGPMFTLTVNECKISTGSGGTLRFNGTVVATGGAGDTCVGGVPADLTVTIPTLEIEHTSAAGSVLATFTSVTAGMSFFGTAPAPCTYNETTLHLGGTITVVNKDALGTVLATTEAVFHDGSTIDVLVSEYGTLCRPVRYVTTVDGSVELNTNGNNFLGVFSSYALDDDATSGEDVIFISGNVESPCFGGLVGVVSDSAMHIAEAAVCPVAGILDVSKDPDLHVVEHTPTGGVLIDLGSNQSIDESFATCLDPRLFVCPSS